MPISTNKPFSQEEEPNGEDSTPRSRFGSAFLEMLRKNQDASAFQASSWRPGGFTSNAKQWLLLAANASMRRRPAAGHV